MTSMVISQEMPAYEFKVDSLTADAASPVTTKAWYVLGAGSILTGIIMLDKHNLDDQAKKKTEFDPPFKKYGYIGEVVGWGYLNSLYILGFGLYGHFFENKKSLERSEMMLSSSFYTLLTTSLIKLSVSRKRPGFPQKSDSFPSGHSSMSFNFATLILAEHGLYYGVPALAVASAISYSRVNDSWHWLSDIVAGASIGASYGLGVYLNRRVKKVPFIFTFVPDLEKKSLAANVSFSF